MGTKNAPKLRKSRARRVRLFLAGAMSERKAVIKNADMSEDMQQEAIDCSTQVRRGVRCFGGSQTQ
jgi:hypothetical protein